MDDIPPWADPDWLAQMTAWIDRCLAEAGIRRRGGLRQVRTWSRAGLLTFDTDRGRMWAKDVPEVFAHEVAVTLLLADVDPGIVPSVVAADVARGRIITEHVDGPSLAAAGTDDGAWTATLSRLAELQRVLSVEPDELAVAGVARAPLARLAEAVPGVLADDDLLLVGRPGGLTTSEAAAIRRRGPELVDACAALDASGVPESLEHGDLTADEVILGEMGPVFLDWSDGSRTHPFLSAASLLASANGHDGAEADGRVAAYLGPWLDAGIGLTEVTGRAAVAAARTVLPLHIATLYRDRILPAIGDGSLSDPVVVGALRTLLRS